MVRQYKNYNEDYPMGGGHHRFPVSVDRARTMIGRCDLCLEVVDFCQKYDYWVYMEYAEDTKSYHAIAYFDGRHY
jgi:hypothetical protein